MVLPYACSFDLWDFFDNFPEVFTTLRAASTFGICFCQCWCLPEAGTTPCMQLCGIFFDKFPARSFSLLSPLYMERKVSTCHFRHTKLPRHILPTISVFSHLTTKSVTTPFTFNDQILTRCIFYNFSPTFCVTNHHPNPKSSATHSIAIKRTHNRLHIPQFLFCGLTVASAMELFNLHPGWEEDWQSQADFFEN